MTIYQKIVRSGLFLLPPETAHEVAKIAFSTGFPWRLLTAKRADTSDDRLKTVIAGMTQANPIGLSAGFDKDARALRGLAQLGFGSITVGTIMPTRRRGNPKTRLVRLPEQRAVLNCLGLPSAGLDVAVMHLRRHHSRPSSGPPVVANIGGFVIDDVLTAFRAIEPVADAVELDLTCPNVRVDGELSTTRGIVRTMKLVESERTKPLLIKLPIRSTDDDRRRGLEMAEAAAEIGLDGISASGNFRVSDDRLSMKLGSLTGPPCFSNTVKVVKELRAVIGDEFPIRASGGASGGEDVFRLLDAGASVVNIFTTFVYRGLATPALMCRELLEAMDQQGVASVEEFGRG